MIWDDLSNGRPLPAKVQGQMLDWFTDVLDRQRERVDAGRPARGRISVGRLSIRPPSEQTLGSAEMQREKADLFALRYGHGPGRLL